MVSPYLANSLDQTDERPADIPSKLASPTSASSNSSSSLSNYLERATPNSLNISSASPTFNAPLNSGTQQPQSSSHGPIQYSSSSSTPTMKEPPSGGGSQTKRHSMRSPPSRQDSFHSNMSTSLERTYSSQSSFSSSQQQQQQQSSSTAQQRPTSPVISPSIHKSLTALDAKSITQSITRDMERSSQYMMRGDDIVLASPSSPTFNSNPGNFYFSPSTQPASSAASVISGTTSGYHPHPYTRQGSVSSVPIGGPAAAGSSSGAASIAPPPSGDVWQTLCVRVLPLFNGEGVQGNIEDLNELLRRCLTDPVSPQLYEDIEGLLRDGMFTLNAKMLGVSDEKLLDRLVEQWSFFFTYALPYFEAVFLPLRTDVQYRSLDEAEMWNVRNMALQSFRDNVILMQAKRLEDAFAKLFTEFGSSQNPAATAAKMLQMTSLLASAPGHNEEMERILSSLRTNWKVMMTKGDRRGFAGVRRPRTGQSSESSHQIFGNLT